MLKVDHVSKIFFKGTVNEKAALGDLSFTLQSGEFAVIIGGNGSGKSTLLNCIAGTLQADDGSIFLDGKNLNRLPEYRRAGMIGRVFQDPLRGTAPTMTIAENLSLAVRRGRRRGLQWGLRKKEIESYRQALEQLGLGLENRIHTQVGLLSGGQRQALTLLMATIARPKLLLLDEHTAALDPGTARTVMNITKNVVGRQKLSALMVTHNMHDALTYGNRTIFMHEGKIVLDISGAAREAMSAEDLANLFHRHSGEDYDEERVLFAQGI